MSVSRASHHFVEFSSCEDDVTLAFASFLMGFFLAPLSFCDNFFPTPFQLSQSICFSFHSRSARALRNRCNPSRSALLRLALFEHNSTTASSESAQCAHI